MESLYLNPQLSIKGLSILIIKEHFSIPIHNVSLLLVREEPHRNNTISSDGSYLQALIFTGLAISLSINPTFI